MDYDKLIANLKKPLFAEGSYIVDHSRREAAKAITELLVENQALRNAANGFKKREEEAKEIASELCDDFTDFVTGGVHNAAPVVHGTPMLRCRPERYERYEEYGLNGNGEMLYLKRIMVDEKSYAMYCPACGKRLCSRFTSFCPNCGAKMDGEE